MASIQQKGGSWTLRWRENGKRHRKTLTGVTSKREAKAHLQAFEAQQAQKPNIGAPTLAEYFQHYCAEHELKTARSTHERVLSAFNTHLLPTFGQLRLTQIEPTVAVDYCNARRNHGAAHGTIEKEIRQLKAVLNHAAKSRVVFEHPLADFSVGANTVDKPPPYYSLDELQLLLAQSNHRARWQLMVNTGIRRSEALQLRKEHIDGRVLHVVSTEHARTKSGRRRTIPINDAAGAALDELLHKNETGFVMPQMNHRSLSRAFDRDIKRLELPGSLHWLRHTFCTHHVLAGTPIRAVQQLAGHSTIAVTERYCHVLNELGKFGENVSFGEKKFG